MDRRSRRFGLLAALLVAAVPLMGCAFAADLINPSFFASLGLDPATIVPPAGRVIVAFKNDTTGVAAFSAVVALTQEAADGTSTNASDVTVLAADNVAAGETRTLVVDCPFFAIQPADFVVVTSSGTATWSYQGFAIQYGEDFDCGDIVEISVVQVVNTDGTTGFDNRVRILPGR